MDRRCSDICLPLFYVPFQRRGLVGSNRRFGEFSSGVVFGRGGTLVLSAVISILVLAAPQIVFHGLSVDSVKEISQYLPPSARHRLAMWSFVVEKIDEKPMLGWGLDASRFIPQESRRLAPNMELMPLHPHNALLQVRLELGMPGIVLIAILVGVFFTGIRGISNRFSSALIVGAGGGRTLLWPPSPTESGKTGGWPSLGL